VYSKLGDGWHPPYNNNKKTKTSAFFQDSQPGLDTLVNAKRVGSENVEILDDSIDDDIINQILNSTGSKFIFPFNDQRVQNFDQILKNVLSTCDGETFCHSQLYNSQKSSQHSEFNKTTDMELRYNSVASQFDDKTKIRASSAFGNFEGTKEGTKTTVPSGLVSAVLDNSLATSLISELGGARLGSAPALGSSLSDSLSSSLGSALGDSLGNSLRSTLGSELGAPLVTSPPSLNSTPITSSISTEEAMPDLVDVPRKMMKNFIKHMDTHSDDSSLFASVSKGDAYCYLDLHPRWPHGGGRNRM
jgi:hypothetical protein